MRSLSPRSVGESVRLIASVILHRSHHAGSHHSRTGQSALLQEHRLLLSACPAQRLLRHATEANRLLHADDRLLHAHAQRNLLLLAEAESDRLLHSSDAETVGLLHSTQTESDRLLSLHTAESESDGLLHGAHSDGLLSESDLLLQSDGLLRSHAESDGLRHCWLIRLANLTQRGNTLIQRCLELVNRLNKEGAAKTNRRQQKQRVRVRSLFARSLNAWERSVSASIPRSAHLCARVLVCTDDEVHGLLRCEDRLCELSGDGLHVVLRQNRTAEIHHGSSRHRTSHCNREDEHSTQRQESASRTRRIGGQVNPLRFTRPAERDCCCCHSCALTLCIRADRSEE